jgi:hypothetical protein
MATAGSSGGGTPAGDDAPYSGSGGGSSSGYISSSGSSGGGGDDGGSGYGDDGSSPDPAPDAQSGPCNFAGFWASKLTIDVSWQPQGLNSIILAPGSGQIKQWIRGSRAQQGMNLIDATVVCGIELPDFTGTSVVGGETYGVVFPPSLFDSHYLPVFTVNGSVTGLMPGAAYSTTATAALLGISLTNPATDAWPSTVTTEVDMDMDGKPGVTINVATGPTTNGGVYSDIPVGIPALGQPTVRATKLHVAIRQVTSVSATVTDCNHMMGVVSIPSVGGKPGIDSHVLGCTLEDGGDCSTTAPFGSTSQAAFVDNTQPVFTPTGSGTLTSIRVPAATSCASVRQMLP